MKKILVLFLLLFVGCSNNSLTCSKSNYSIYGEEVEYQIFEYKNNNFFNYNLIKKITLDNNVTKYIDEINNSYLLEKKIIEESIKSASTTVQKENNIIISKTSINIRLTDDTITKINLNKNLSLEYVQKNLSKQGYNCDIEE